MKTVKYNKLVRDLIPDEIESSGKHATYEIVSEKEYVELLNKKLREEVEEYLQDESIEELADVLEVVYAIAEAQNSTVAELEVVRDTKALTRGKFKKRIKLVEVYEE